MKNKTPSLGKPTKITGGTLRGRKILTPGGATHPMGSRERLALFNMLDPKNCTVLDLFAGAGCLGLEALSRGAKKVAFVESSASACRVIKENLAALDLTRQASVIKSSATVFHSTEKFDLVFVDPPYDHPCFSTKESISTFSSFVKSGAYLVISHPKSVKIHLSAELPLLKSRSYAGANIAIIHKL